MENLPTVDCLNAYQIDNYYHFDNSCIFIGCPDYPRPGVNFGILTPEKYHYDKR